MFEIDDIRDELRRLAANDAPTLGVSGNIAEILVCTASVDPVEVANRATSVLTCVARTTLVEPDWPSTEQWRKILPTWFVDVCAAAEAEDHPSSGPTHSTLGDFEAWSLDDWIFWMIPEEREWLWYRWDQVDESSINISLVVSGIPFPTGSLQWLLIACGAREISKRTILMPEGVTLWKASQGS